MKRDFKKEKEYLFALANRIDEEVRKERMKYSRRKWIDEYLMNKLNICFEETKEEWSGYFTTVKNEDKKYKIVVNSDYLKGNTLNPSMRTTKKQKILNKKIMDILKHELCHYYMKFWFDDYSYSDNSPLFMAMLFYINPNERNAYFCCEDFKDTKMFKETQALENLFELERYLMRRETEIEKLQSKYPFVVFKFADAFEFDDEYLIDVNGEWFDDPDEERWDEWTIRHDIVKMYKENHSDEIVKSLEEMKTNRVMLEVSIEGDGSEINDETIAKKIAQINETIEIMKAKPQLSDVTRIVLPRDLSDIDKIVKDAESLALKVKAELESKNNIIKI